MPAPRQSQAVRGRLRCVDDHTPIFAHGPVESGAALAQSVELPRDRHPHMVAVGLQEALGLRVELPPTKRVAPLRANPRTVKAAGSPPATR